MKVNIKRELNNCIFDDIDTGEVFYNKDDPQTFFLRTDDDAWVAVDIATGVLYHKEDFNIDDKLYRIVEAEVTIS